MLFVSIQFVVVFRRKVGPESHLYDFAMEVRTTQMPPCAIFCASVFWYSHIGGTLCMHFCVMFGCLSDASCAFFCTVFVCLVSTLVSFSWYLHVSRALFYPLYFGCISIPDLHV